MKKSPSHYIVFLVLTTCFSCNGQGKTDRAHETISQTHAESDTLPQKDYDPYFVETQTITSPYGPGSITRNILQDKNGDMWFASWEGIMHYSEKTQTNEQPTFTNFTNKDGLRRYHVFSVLEDRTGHLWFGTIGAGVYRYDGNVNGTGNGVFTNFTTRDGLANDRLGCFYEDHAGMLWIGTMGGVTRYDPLSEVQPGFRNFTTSDGLTNNDINAIVEDRNGHYWFGTRGEACVYDGEVFSTPTHTDGRPFVNVRTMIRDQEDNIWLGGKDGLWQYDGVTFTNFTTDFVGYIYEDKSGSIWTGSVSIGERNWALTRYDKPTPPQQQISATHIAEQEGQIFGIMEDADGNIWYGHEQGICRFDGKSLPLTRSGFECFSNRESKN